MVSPLCTDSITKRRACVIHLLLNCIHNIQEMYPCPLLYFFTPGSPPPLEICCLCTFSFGLDFLPNESLVPKLLCVLGRQVMLRRWHEGNMNFNVPLNWTTLVCSKCLTGCHLYLMFFFYLWCVNTSTNSNKALQRWNLFAICCILKNKQINKSVVHTTQSTLTAKRHRIWLEHCTSTITEHLLYIHCKYCIF